MERVWRSLVLLVQNLLRLLAHPVEGVLRLAQAIGGVVVERGIGRVLHQQLQAGQHLGALGFALLRGFHIPRPFRQEPLYPANIKPGDLALEVVKIPLPGFASQCFLLNSFVIKIFHNDIIRIKL